MALGHLDELQKAEKYPLEWSFWKGFTVILKLPPGGVTSFFKYFFLIIIINYIY